MSSADYLNFEFYLDMDGVLVNFAKGLASLIGMPYEEFMSKWTPGCWDLAPLFGFSEDDLWHEDTGLVCKQPAKFYSDLEQFHWSNELLTHCKSLGDTRFLTTSVRSGACMHGKYDWIRKFAGAEGPEMLITAKPKYKLAKSNRFLIDVKPKNIKKFNESGGRGILFPSRGNELHAMENDPLPYVFEEIRAGMNIEACMRVNNS